MNRDRRGGRRGGEGGHGSRGKMRWCRERGEKWASIFPLPLRSSLSVSSLFSLSCVWVLFCQCRLYLRPPLPPLSLLSYFLPFSSSPCLSNLSFFYSSQALALCQRKMKAIHCAGYGFSDMMLQAKSSGVPEHVLTTPTHRTSRSTFKQQ